MLQRIALTIGLICVIIWGSISNEEDQQFFVEKQVYIKIKSSQNKLPPIRSTQQLNKLQHYPELYHLAQQFTFKYLKCPFVTSRAGLKNIYKIKWKSNKGENQLIQKLQQISYIRYAEKIPAYELYFTPNDYDSLQRWYMDTVDAPLAWDKSRGNANVKIAVLDNAIDYDHPDLKGDIWRNRDDTPGDSVDNDNNGYIDDLQGWDVADNDNDPSPPYLKLFGFNVFVHGTHVSGIASAVTDNDRGIAGMGFGTSLIPVKVTEDSSLSPFSVSHPAEGLDYAIAAGADVINMSWGGDTSQLPNSKTIHQLVEVADSLGIVLVAASGNSGDTSLTYPAAYEEVIAVGATTRKDKMAGFSNYGSWLDVVAPGDSLWSTLPDSLSYGKKQGTSMASPLVAGITGLMLSYNPNYTKSQITACLKAGCENIDASNPSYVGLMGAGQVNADSALACMTPPPAPIAGFYAQQDTFYVNDTTQLIDTSQNAPMQWSWQLPNGNPSSSKKQMPTVSYSEGGKYKVTLKVSNASGSDQVSKDNYITVLDTSNTGIADYQRGNLEVYPNPIRGEYCYLQCPSAYSIGKKVKLINAEGQIVKRYELPANQHSWRLNIPSSLHGLYFLKAVHQQNMWIKKVLII